MGRSVLIDTNVIIDLFHRRMPQAGGLYVAKIINSGDYHLSAINQIELMGYSMDGEQELFLKDVVSNATVLPISEAVVEKTIELKQLRKIKTPDAIVAATAIVFDLKIITRNTKDFKNLNLEVIDSHQL